MSGPELITDNYMPSENLYKWSNDMGLELAQVHKCLYDFIFWHKQKKVKRKDFNRAFQNWLKKEFDLVSGPIKKKNKPFTEYKPPELIVKNKEKGRAALKNLKSLIS